VVGIGHVAGQSHDPGEGFELTSGSRKTISPPGVDDQ
jgi:hypothetical protein